MARLPLHARGPRPWLCFYALILAAVLLFGGRADAERPPALNDEPQAAKTFRPTTAEDHEATLTVADLDIPELVNRRGVEIFTTSPDVKSQQGAPATFNAIAIRNVEIGNLKRDEVGALTGAQVEGIRITGGGDQQPVETDVLIEDVYIHDGQGMPIRIQDGKFGTITFRRVRIEQMLVPAVHVVFINSGSARRIQIEDSPGLVLRLMGSPGSVGEIATSGSPDARIQDELSPRKPAVAEAVADGGKAGDVLDPVKLSVPPTTTDGSTAVKPATTKLQPKPPAAEPAKPVGVTAVAEDGSVRVTVTNVPTDVSHVTISVFNRFDYRVGAPALLTEAPWEATLKVGKAGTYTVRVTATRAGGDTDRQIERTVELR